MNTPFMIFRSSWVLWMDLKRHMELPILFQAGKFIEIGLKKCEKNSRVIYRLKNSDISCKWIIGIFKYLWSHLKVFMFSSHTTKNIVFLFNIVAIRQFFSHGLFSIKVSFRKAFIEIFKKELSVNCKTWNDSFAMYDNER